MKSETASRLRQCKQLNVKKTENANSPGKTERVRVYVYRLSQWGVCLVLYFQSVVWIASLRTHLTAIMRYSQYSVRVCVCKQTEPLALWVLREGGKKEWRNKIKVRKTDEKRNKNPWSSSPLFLSFMPPARLCKHAPSLLLSSPFPPTPLLFNCPLYLSSSSSSFSPLKHKTLVILMILACPERKGKDTSKRLSFWRGRERTRGKWMKGMQRGREKKDNSTKYPTPFRDFFISFQVKKAVKQLHYFYKQARWLYRGDYYFIYWCLLISYTCKIIWACKKSRICSTSLREDNKVDVNTQIREYRLTFHCSLVRW